MNLRVLRVARKEKVFPNKFVLFLANVELLQYSSIHLISNWQFEIAKYFVSVLKFICRIKLI